MLEQLNETRRARQCVAPRINDGRIVYETPSARRVLRHRLAAQIAGDWEQERDELVGALLDAVHLLRCVDDANSKAVPAASESAALALIDIITSIYRIAAIESDDDDDDDDDDDA